MNIKQDYSDKRKQAIEAAQKLLQSLEALPDLVDGASPSLASVAVLGMVQSSTEAARCHLEGIKGSWLNQ